MGKTHKRPMHCQPIQRLNQVDLHIPRGLSIILEAVLLAVLVFSLK